MNARPTTFWHRVRAGRNRASLLAVVTLLASGTTTALARDPLPTTVKDFFHPGSQPNATVVYDSFRSSSNCMLCHAEDASGTPIPIYPTWQGSMMAQAARDPLFYAGLTVANQDVAFVGDVCLRCHTAGGWLAGRSSPTDGSALNSLDRDGVSCSVCHRMVDPEFKPGISPVIDELIIDNLDDPSIGFGSGNFIMDPIDERRGPYSDPMYPGHTTVYSPFHKTSKLCATCHDVSNPAYQRQPDGTYVLNRLDTPHATGLQYDMFPLERTYSEWKNSTFAAAGVDMGGRFGGNITMVSTCEDCHMPRTTSVGALGSVERDDLARHELTGGNAWAQQMVLNLYPDDGLDPQNLQDGMARARSMLARASTLELSQVGNHVNVRIVNETGHKLPTGYPEGRRMWINVIVRNADLDVLREYGHYDDESADLDTASTKVYEAHFGLDDAMAELTGLPAGQSFRFALNNVILKDNRIPPRGFTNAAFEAAQAAPVAADYADGQYWDDTRFRLPPGADSVDVRVFYQTSSKDYIEFLRDENHTNDDGDVLYAQWELTGKSPPVLMAESTLAVEPFPSGDANDDARIDLVDLLSYEDCEGSPTASFPDAGCDVFDFDVDGDVDLRDFAELQLVFTN